MPGTNITIKEVTRENWNEALQLELVPGQVGRVAPVAETVAEAFVRPHEKRISTPFAIYSGATMVGFFALSYDPESTSNYWIEGLLIDRRHQRKGHARAAMAETMRQLPERFPQCRQVKLLVYSTNTAARRLYEGLGFREFDIRRLGKTSDSCDCAYVLDLKGILPDG